MSGFSPYFGFRCKSAASQLFCMESRSGSPEMKGVMPNSNNGDSVGAEALLGAKKRIGYLGNALLKKKDKLIHLALAGAFISLSVRSWGREHEIEDLEGQTASLEKENKALKNKMWILKQGLLEAAAKESNHDLTARLKTLFGQGNVAEKQEDSTAPKPRFVV